jgi:hypothetical protein
MSGAKSEAREGTAENGTRRNRGGWRGPRQGLGIGQLAGIWILMLGFVSRVEAIPAFARKYGMRCSACHEAWPLLNDFGRAFRDNGYQLLEGQDEPISLPPAYWPVSIRISPHYEFTSVDHQDTDQGAKKIKTGNIADVGLDLLTAGTLIQDVSFLVVATGFTKDAGVTLESAWVRFDNLLGSPCLARRTGRST